MARSTKVKKPYTPGGEKSQAELIQELQELIVTKDQVFSIIAHDLRSPFNVILGATDQLLADIPDLNENEIRNYLEMIQSASLQTYTLLENLLLWARVKGNTIDIRPECASMLILADKVIGLLDHPAVRKGIIITRQIPEETIMCADINMIHSVLQNLLSNAIKFTPYGGCVHVEANRKNGEIEVSVRDSGVGIEAEKLGELFRTGRHAVRGTDNEPGSGLGLVICMDFVEKHGGKIWAESEPGKGSVFRFTIPANKTSI